MGLHCTLSSSSLISIISVAATDASGPHNSTVEKLLRTKLLSSTVYDPVSRPDGVIHVMVSFHLLSIEELVRIFFLIKPILSFNKRITKKSVIYRV